MGVTHFLMLSKTNAAPYLKVARTPQGPTLTFKINEYSLASDVAQSQLRPRCPKDLFKNSPLIVLSGFGTGEQHLKLMTIMFQNIFPAIDVNTVKLSSCQRIVLLNYNKETKLIDFRAGYGSKSEIDEEAASVTLVGDLGRVNKASSKSAVRLQEIGPRMILQLVRVEEGLCTGGVIFSEYGYGTEKQYDALVEDSGRKEDDDAHEMEEDTEDGDDG